MEEKEESAKFADPRSLPRPSGLGVNVSWCARALELSRRDPCPYPRAPGLALCSKQ